MPPARLAPRSGRKEEAKAATAAGLPTPFLLLRSAAASPASHLGRFLLCSAPPAPPRHGLTPAAASLPGRGRAGRCSGAARDRGAGPGMRDRDPRSLPVPAGTLRLPQRRAEREARPAGSPPPRRFSPAQPPPPGALPPCPRAGPRRAPPPLGGLPAADCPRAQAVEEGAASPGALCPRNAGNAGRLRPAQPHRCSCSRPAGCAGGAGR